MSRKSFGQLLQKYLKGECTTEEKAFVEHWFGLLEAETGESGQNIDMDELEGRLWNQIQSKMEADEEVEAPKIIPLRSFPYRWAGVAAVLLLVSAWWLTTHYEQNPGYAPTFITSFTFSSDWVERTNASEKPITIRLEDGSSVRLEAKSSLRFPKHFSQEKRTVYLNGTAFFDIQKIPSRPFFVHTGDVITKVLGTSFFVRTEPSTRQVRVEVVTGKVAVYEQTAEKQTNGVVLNPNQAATYFGEQKHFVTGLVEKPVILQSTAVEQKEISFRFDDTPLSDVLARLELAYGIDIEVESEQQNHCPLTADLTDQPLYTQLDIICAALKADYEVRGTTILISGKGCDN